MLTEISSVNYSPNLQSTPKSAKAEHGLFTPENFYKGRLVKKANK